MALVEQEPGVPEDRPTVRIVAADDSPIFLDAVQRIIAGDPRLSIVGIAADGESALELIRAEMPDVALLDVSMPRLGGIEIARALAAEQAPTRVLFLSEYTTGDVVFDALVAGGAGFLSKSARFDEVLDAVVRVAAGESVIAGGIEAGLVTQMRSIARPKLLLTDRELQILQRMASGATLKEIGDELHLALPTIKTHAQHLYGRLGVSDRSAAVAEAMRRGIIS
jgi:two-component system, NarL family, nitrate/nitrite response regulator NarL